MTLEQGLRLEADLNVILQTTRDRRRASPPSWSAESLPTRGVIPESKYLHRGVNMEMSSVSHCPHCGAEIQGDSLFCGACGRPIVAEGIRARRRRT